MKSFLRALLGCWLLLAAASAARAQVLTVDMVLPGNEANGPAGSPVQLQARVTGTASLYNTQFFVNGAPVTLLLNHASALVPTSLPSPVAQWTPPQPGVYFVTATTTDAVGNRASALAVRYFATGTVVSNPLPNTLVPIGSSVVIKADATPASGFVRQIEFFVDGVSQGIDETAPYSILYTPPASPITHEITAVATDNNGNVLPTSTPVQINSVAPIGLLPTVSVASPANDSALRIPDYAQSASAAIPISVIANDADGLVSKVEIYVDGVLVSVDQQFPYGFLWQPQATGTYRIAALAFDDKNNVVASSSNRVVISAPPSVTITSPADGSTFSAGAPVTLTANASDSDGTVTSVQFFADGVLVGDDSTAPYSVAWTPLQKRDGTFTFLNALATDNFGITTLSRTINVTVTGSGGGGGSSIGLTPTVTLTSPDAGTRVRAGDTITLGASATDPDGNVLSVQFFANGQSVGSDSTFPYSTTWTPNSLGAYALVVKALDNDGNVASATVPVDVVAPSAGLPQVALVSPVDGALGTVGAPVALAATAVDSDGTITAVEFSVSGEAIGTATAFPYVVPWVPSAPGVYSVAAIATDNAGNRVGSAVATVTVRPAVGNVPVASLAFNDPTRRVDNPPKEADLLKPVDVAYGSKLILSAGVVDEGGTVTNASFFINGRRIASVNAAPFYTVTSLDTLSNVIATVVVTDDSGNVTSAAPLAIRTVASNAAAPLEVKLASPLTGASYTAGGQIVFAASHNAGNRPSPVIDYYVNGSIFTTVTAEPFTANLGITRAGAYDIHAVLRAENRTTVSQVARITVKAGSPPKVSMTSPASGSASPLGRGFTVSASASDVDGTISDVQFFANGAPIGSSSAAPYTVSFNPASPGVYRITALAKDSSGQQTMSAAASVLVSSDTSAMGGDTIYTGNFSAGTESGRITLINSGGQTAVAIAQTNGPTPSFYFYQGITVDSGGGFGLTDSTGATLISGRFSDTGATGTFDGGRVSFISPLTFGTSTTAAPSGLYNGNLTGRASSSVVGIVGADGTLSLYVAEGTARDAGSGGVSASGAFAFNLASGARVSGTIQMANRFISGTISGGSLAGTFTGAASSGGTFSDGVLRNVSTRGLVGTGERVLVAGFVVAGDQPKRMLLRAVGPSLASLGVTGVLANPNLQLYRGQSVINQNDDWGNNAEAQAAAAQVGALPLPAGSLDSALVVTLNPGIYTAVVSGVSAGTGVALVEVFDLDVPEPFTAQKVLNLSTRGDVGTGDRALLVGFVVNGTSAKKVLIRAAGPALGALGVSGVLTDPFLRVFQGSTVIRENDNWESGNNLALLREGSAKTGAFAFPAGGKDAAVLLTLPPGSYTAQVSGVAGATGVGLVEVYEVP